MMKHRHARARVWLAATALGSSVALLLTGCGAAPPTANGADAAASRDLQNTTPAAVGEYGPITWANYRPVASLDPIQAMDQPEGSVLNSLCEGLLMQEGDGTIAPWLAESAEYTGPTELVITLKPGVTFWDGTAVTPEDVVYSLERAKDPALSLYADGLQNIASLAVTGDNEVTVRLAQPDYWLRGFLATSASTVIKKGYAEGLGAEYGTPPGNVMCTGAFTLKSWQAGGDVVVERNANYWDAENAALVPQITFVAAPGGADLNAGLTSGSIDGTFNPVITGYEQLAADDSVTVTSGWNTTIDALAVMNFDGVLGDLRVREALSLAMDRKAYLGVAYAGGQASVPRSSTNSSVWSQVQDAYDKVLGGLKPMTQDLARAKQLIAEAGVEGETIVMASTSLPSITAASNAVVQAGSAIGLKIELKNFAVADYTSIFYDPSARQGIDVASTSTGGMFAEPGPDLTTVVLPNALYNYGGWSDPKVTDLLTRARQTEDPIARATLVAQADKIVTENLPLIPLAEQHYSLVMSKEITGPPASGTGYTAGPWARMVGAAEQ
ncbi:ABC transporter substrate-binding protein [Leucobacter sp. wl10]|uniref:ABC transporter substrate-binding protein n=1 Tax=Leucobacter sp. wl10 TaxID=2304677 RepID=UPI000E5BAB56|nr:ABC transporter substrate-binding protein [Leucobacter sp. wl10]RGE17645.1 ABC transporter substrate-binding protein [Leucobacter sp. wl10]